jgi:hypothetical protein
MDATARARSLLEPIPAHSTAGIRIVRAGRLVSSRSWFHVNVTSDHDGVVHGTISHIDIAVSLPACSFAIDGTAGASGIARVTYIDSAHTLELLPAGGNLHFSNVSGCKHLFHEPGHPGQPGRPTRCRAGLNAGQPDHVAGPAFRALARRPLRPARA